MRIGRRGTREQTGRGDAGGRRGTRGGSPRTGPEGGVLDPARSGHRRRAPGAALGAALGIALVASPAAAGPLDVRLNEIQVVGTHNSYHIQPEPALLAVLASFVPAVAPTLEYTHLPLPDQFEFQGIRQIELDVFFDPAGGLYAEPLGLTLFDPSAHLAELDPPGIKVLHVQDVDFRTTCPTLVDCLLDVKAWSDAHPEHLPIAILIEAKDDPIEPDFGFPFVIPVPIGPAELDALDAEIRSVFPEERLITPDFVRGRHRTLADAIRRDGWPTLREVRGRVLFALDNGGTVRDLYLQGHPSLAGRVLFVDSSPGDDVAAFAKRNDPVGGQAEIRDLVARGFLVRTRADADTLEARTGDTTRRDLALASGAQFVSTDYPDPDPFGMGYVVELPGGGVARCNPVSAGPDCADFALENLTGAWPVAGSRLLLRDRAGSPEARRVAATLRDPLLEIPRPGTASDPRLAGATVTLENPGTGEAAVFALPAGGAWQGLGVPAGDAGYVYRDPGGAAGPCRTLVVQRGRRLVLRCDGRAGPIPFSLDEASQGVVEVRVAFGSGAVVCARFGGTVRRDAGTGSPPGRGVFRAVDAPAPASCGGP